MSTFTPSGKFSRDYGFSYPGRTGYDFDEFCSECGLRYVVHSIHQNECLDVEKHKDCTEGDYMNLFAVEKTMFKPPEGQRIGIEYEFSESEIDNRWYTDKPCSFPKTKDYDFNWGNISAIRKMFSDGSGNEEIERWCIREQLLGQIWEEKEETGEKIEKLSKEKKIKIFSFKIKRNKCKKVSMPESSQPVGSSTATIPQDQYPF